jgi:putative membrane protein
MFTLLHLAVLALTILVLSRVVSGVQIKTSVTALVVAIVFSVLNFFLGWLIRAVLFVPALLTLGLLFLFVPLIVNTVVLWLTDKLIPSFEIMTMRALLVCALAITLVNAVFYAPFFHRVSQGYFDDGGHRGMRGAPAESGWI